MGSMPLLFSIGFFFVAVIYAFLGIYIIQINLKARINWVFFAVCISLSIWAFGFAIAISAPDIDSSYFWRRVSAIGWGTMYSILLHFFLLLTQKNSLLRKRWIYPLIYLPALVIIYVFVISNDHAMVQHNLVKTTFGWTNISRNNMWDWFFHIYYTSFMICGIALIWLWGKKSNIEQIKNQANLILFSVIVAFALGTITDIIANSYLKITVPQMAPIIILIPISVIFYSIKKYRLMAPKPISRDEVILNEATRIKIYEYLSITFIAGGILSLISQYLTLDNVDIVSTPYFSAMIILIGFSIQMIQRLKMGDNYKDFLFIAIIIIVIPLITLKYIKFASITIWAFPFMLIIISLLFNKRIVLIALTVSILLTQVFIWLFVPHVMVQVDRVDYIVRIGLFSIAIWLAFYVNKVYILRLKENADQIKFQKMISEISSDFVTINQLNFDEKIENMLMQSGNYFQVDRTYAILVDQQSNTMNYTHEWCNNGIRSARASIHGISISIFPWWMKQIISNGVVQVPDVEKLPEEAREEKLLFKKQHTKSLIAIPIIGRGEAIGFLGFDSVSVTKKWRDEHIRLLRIIANILADALTRLEAEKEINYRAYYDHLTKLPNRLLLRDRINQAIYLASRTQKMIGVIFLDLDSFKTVNDTMGHELGDYLLKTVAEKIALRLRKSDTVSRFGGDEFIVMLNNISNWKDMVHIADGIQEMFNKPFLLKGQEFFITASVGIAVYPIDGGDTETLIKYAEIAMYKAKDKGKNQYIFCSSDMKDEVHKKMKLTNSLYRALERNELFLYYQPQVDLKSARVVGLEALLRWNHPEIGIIAPSIFIPLAEQTGLINPIGEWVLRTACFQNKAWHDQGFDHMRIAVNISVNQFKNPNIVQQIERILDETELKPEYLELEITENVAINNAEYIVGVLNDLKRLGLSISIDDFGTEYSSLSRLKMLPIDRIKMDMQFVHGIEGNNKDKAIAKVIIHLAKNLGLKVIAEGVETQQQLDFLSQKKCDEVQGYFYYKPISAEEVDKLLRVL